MRAHALAAVCLLVLAVTARTQAKGPSQPQASATPEATGTFIALEDCPVTMVALPHVPPSPYLTEPPAYYKTAWYGSDDLWTMLPTDAPRPFDLATPSGFTEKTWWWGTNFDINKERQPAITVTGRRLDAAGSFTAGNPGTHAWADFGTAMLVGIEMPSAGCWQIRAEYKGAELSYVVEVVG